MTIDIFAEMEADALLAQETPQALPDDAQLRSVSQLADDLEKIEERISTGEALLKVLKEQRDTLTLSSLPSAMDAVGLSRFDLSSGAVIRVDPFVNAHILKENREKAFAWLKENGHGDIVKHLISVDVGRDDTAAVRAVMALKDAGLAPSDEESVHSSTLKAWVKEQVGAGTPLPQELFGVYVGQKATLKKG